MMGACSNAICMGPNSATESTRLRAETRSLPSPQGGASPGRRSAPAGGSIQGRQAARCSPHLEKIVMPRPAAPPTSLDAITRDLLPDTQALLAELRSLVMTTIPGATEKVALGRRSLNFSHPDVGYFCGLSPRDGQVTVEFDFGVLLPDPAGILVGNSCAKQVRYARIRSLNTLPRAAFQRLLRASVSLPRERSTRIALVRSGARLVPSKPRTKKRTRS